MAKYKWCQLPAKLESLNDFCDFVLQHAEQYIGSQRTLFGIKLALEEILVNIISYAYEGNPDGLVKVGCVVWRNQFRIRVVDNGRVFNPLEWEDPDLFAELEEREIGGLGIFLTKCVTDEINYCRKKNQNILTLSYLLDKHAVEEDFSHHDEKMVS